MKLLQELTEGKMKRSDPWISGDRSGPRTEPIKDYSIKPEKKTALRTRIENLAAKAKVSAENVEALYKAEVKNVSPDLENRFQVVWSNVKKKLNLTEEAEIDDGDEDDGVYEREKKVSLLILRVFRKCGIEVAEHESLHSGVKDEKDYWGYDVLYTEDEREADVTVEEATLSQLAKLNNSGLFDGECRIVGTSNHAMRLSFKVHENIASGDAELS